MKIILLVFASFLLICSSIAQSGQWTWMKGDSIGNSNGIFGTIGIPDAANNPPAVYEPASWTDNQGNFWLFGGISYSTSSNFYNALWKFEPLTNNWVWVKGPGTANAAGVYGTQGIPDANNIPGARAYGSASWTDSVGNLWMFAGFGYDSQGFMGELNDFWKYDIGTNEWTWMKGSAFVNSIGFYGTQGIENATNDIPARSEAVAAWTGKNNYLWYFGGYHNAGDMNDLWRYNINTNNWTWMKGSSSFNLSPVYGTLGIPDAANDPGGRSVYSRWVDCDGNLWFYGGNTWLTISQRSDMWKYDPATNEYTWMNGLTTFNDAGEAGNFCESDSNFYPKARYENRACWRDNHGNFWMFGGFTLSGTFNDLWVYSTTTNQWRFVSGSLVLNQPGSYGQQGIYSPFNVPGGKMGPVCWIGNDGSLWLFGGNKKLPFTLVSMNDLWRYVPDSSCTGNFNFICNAFPSPGFNAGDTAICEKFCTDFFDQSTNDPNSWQWFFPGGSPASSTDQNPVNICYTNPGTYDVILVTTNAAGNDTLTLTNYITVYATPPFPTITQNGYVLTSSPGVTYQWQYNTVDIPAATNQSYAVTQSGIYTVEVTDSNGCFNSGSLEVIISGTENLTAGFTVSIHPNPVKENVNLEIEGGSEDIEIILLTPLGQRMLSKYCDKIASHTVETFDVRIFPAGTYFMEIRSSGGVGVWKVIKE